MNGMRPEQREFLRLFSWESKEQREGFLSFLKWVSDKKLDFRLLTQQYELFIVFAFLIQKNHEAFEWWRDTVADQLALLRGDWVEQENHRLARETEVSAELAALRKEIEWLKRASH